MRNLNFTGANLIAVILSVSSCRDATTGCPDEQDVLTSFVSETDVTGIVTNSGEAYIQDDNGCTFLVQYFTPGFDSIYIFSDSGLYIQTEEGDLFPVTNSFFDDCENYDTFLDLMATSIEDTDKHWNSFVLQSPLAQTVDEYVDLRACILNETCDFLDNRIDVVSDPVNASNTVIQLTSVAPSENMITAKSSIERTFNYFNKGMDLWFEAKYFIVSGMPFSFADFENSYFDQSPGPRIIVDGNALAIENKFGDKIEYIPLAAPEIPLGQWFTIKVHFQFSETNTGIIELWQDGVLLMSITGINLPLFNSIQNSLEVGVSSTSVGCVLLVDDIRLSPEAF